MTNIHEYDYIEKINCFYSFSVSTSHHGFSLFRLSSLLMNMNKGLKWNLFKKNNITI